MRHALSSPLLAAALLMAGCAEWVNIPPIPGGAARHDPNIKDVIAVESEALAVVLQKFDYDGPTRVILPKGSTRLTYAHVLEKVGRQTVMPDQPAAVTLDVQAVRIRTTEAWVDIQRTSEMRIAQLMTVYLKHDIVSGWYLDRVRVWRGTVNPNTQPPYFPPSSELPDDDGESAAPPPPPAPSSSADQPRPVESDVIVTESTQVIEVTDE